MDMRNEYAEAREKSDHRQALYLACVILARRLPRGATESWVEAAYFHMERLGELGRGGAMRQRSTGLASLQERGLF